MPASLPYLSSPGTVDTAVAKIKSAATPPRFTTDFVRTVLQIKGGTGAAIPPFLKKLGLLNPDATPSPLYDRLRNDSTSKAALGEAMRIGYRPLFDVNEYAHKATDTELKGLILQVTGASKGDRLAELIYGTFKKLKSHASFDSSSKGAENKVRRKTDVGETTREQKEERLDETDAAGLRLSYSITLNLPSSTNIEVYNAIFRSLRENLLDA
jgi:Family of unknown function (DUF5343)